MRSGQSSRRAPVSVAVPRPRKRLNGRTPAAETPLALRTSGVDVTPDLRRYVHARLGFRLGKFARHIERLTVRFKDVNGPRGGVDTACRIKVVVSRLPSVVVDERAADAAEAFNRADDRVERAVRRAIGRAQDRGHLAGVRPPRRDRPPAHVRPVLGATERGGSVGPPTFKRSHRKATAALEVSAGARPSRKSTRRSANRAKQGNKLGRRQVRRVSSPKARKAQGRRRR